MSYSTGIELCLIVFVSAGIAFVCCFQTDFGTFLQVGLKTAFIGTLSVFALQFIITRIVRIVHSRREKPQTHSDKESESKYEVKTKSSREVSQQEFDKQRESYKERILVPREEAKKAKKEEEFLRFLGPTWKGKGLPLGGVDGRSSEDHDVDGREAAELRQLPMAEIKNIPQSNQPKKKKVIVLPEEPDETDPNCVVVVLRTPVHTEHRRRFPELATVQNVLDYMTTAGFHQIGYTLSTSYPRQNLTELREKTLAELGFHKQVILNVEEKDL